MGIRGRGVGAGGGLGFFTAFRMTFERCHARERGHPGGGGKWVSVCSGTTFAIAAEAGIRRSYGGLLADGLRFFAAFRMTFERCHARERGHPGGGGKWVSVPVSEYGASCSGTTFAIAAEAGIRRSDGGLLADGLRFFTAFRMTFELPCSRTRASRWRGEVGFRLHWNDVCHCCGSRYSAE